MMYIMTISQNTTSIGTVERLQCQNEKALSSIKAIYIIYKPTTIGSESFHRICNNTETPLMKTEKIQNNF